MLPSLLNTDYYDTDKCILMSACVKKMSYTIFILPRCLSTKPNDMSPTPGWFLPLVTPVSNAETGVTTLLLQAIYKFMIGEA